MQKWWYVIGRCNSSPAETPVHSCSCGHGVCLFSLTNYTNIYLLCNVPWCPSLLLSFLCNLDFTKWEWQEHFCRLEVIVLYRKNASCVFINGWYSLSDKPFAFPCAASISDKFCKAFRCLGFHRCFSVCRENQDRVVELWCARLPQVSSWLLSIIADFQLQDVNEQEVF